MCGTRIEWERGPRTFVTANDKGRETVMRGKNGGPIVRQPVMKRIVPKRVA